MMIKKYSSVSIITVTENKVKSLADSKIIERLDDTLTDLHHSDGKELSLKYYWFSSHQ